MKYYIITTTVHDGEMEYLDCQGMTTDKKTSFHELDGMAIKRIEENWMGKYDSFYEAVVSAHGNMVQLERIEECTKQEWDVLNKFINL